MQEPGENKIRGPYDRKPKMTVDQIRRANINYWADKLGRSILAQKCGYPDTIYINQLCAGHGSFGGRTARKIEKALNLPEGSFDQINDTIRPMITPRKGRQDVDDVDIVRGSVRKVPLISYTQAGEWSEAMDPYELNDAEDWVNAPEDAGQKSFYLWVTGVSMAPDYPEGGMILVDPDIEPRHGDDVVARTPDGNVTFKCFQDTPDGKHLLARNPDYKPRVIEIPTDTVIVGVVTDYTRKVGRFRK